MLARCSCYISSGDNRFVYGRIKGGRLLDLNDGTSGLTFEHVFSFWIQCVHDMGNLPLVSLFTSEWTTILCSEFNSVPLRQVWLVRSRYFDHKRRGVWFLFPASLFLVPSFHIHVQWVHLLNMLLLTSWFKSFYIFWSFGFWKTVQDFALLSCLARVRMCWTFASLAPLRSFDREVGDKMRVIVIDLAFDINGARFRGYIRLVEIRVLTGSTFRTQYYSVFRTWYSLL